MGWVQVLTYLVLQVQVQVEVEVVARRCVRTDCVCRHSSGEDQPTSVSGPGGDLRTPADGPRTAASAVASTITKKAPTRAFAFS